MSAIPDDIKTIAGSSSCEFFARSHEGESEADIIIDIVTSVLAAERQRTDNLIEEVKRVLGPFASLSDNANNGQRYFLQLLVCPVGDKYGGDATDFGPKIRDARSLLSKLEGR